MIGGGKGKVPPSGAPNSVSSEVLAKLVESVAYCSFSGLISCYKDALVLEQEH